MENVITAEKFAQIGKKMKDAQQDTTPYVILDGKNVSVIGDANKTEKKKSDYSIKFRMPKKLFDEIPEGAIVVGDVVGITVQYEEATITPRTDLKIAAAIMEMMPFYETVKEDGEIEEKDGKELFKLFAEASDEVQLAFYNLVATFLGIDDFMAAYMLPGSVFNALVQIIEIHPEIFNETDLFFG